MTIMKLVLAPSINSRKINENRIIKFLLANRCKIRQWMKWATRNSFMNEAIENKPDGDPPLATELLKAFQPKRETMNKVGKYASQKASCGLTR